MVGPGFDSQNTSYSFPHYPNWNLWVCGILLLVDLPDPVIGTVKLAIGIVIDYREKPRPIGPNHGRFGLRNGIIQIKVGRSQQLSNGVTLVDRLSSMWTGT